MPGKPAGKTAGRNRSISWIQPAMFFRKETSFIVKYRRRLGERRRLIPRGSAPDERHEVSK
jgi:hypothetical protein